MKTMRSERQSPVKYWPMTAAGQGTRVWFLRSSKKTVQEGGDDQLSHFTQKSPGFNTDTETFDHLLMKTEN